MIYVLNKEQLSGLANLCFDLAKGAFAVGLFPAASINSSNFLVIASNIVVGITVGVAFVYAALVILQIKGEGT